MLVKIQIGSFELQESWNGLLSRCLLCSTVLIVSLAITPTVVSQDRSNDILLVSVGESSDDYADAATHLFGLLAGADGFADARVDLVQDSNIESLADGFYDQNPEDVRLRLQVAQGYRQVILIPTINTTPNGTIEYTEFGGGPMDVYDDAPLDNKYFAPEVFYEGVNQLSKLILNAGSTPVIFLPNNADEQVNDFGPVMQRVANGVGLNLIPGAQAVQAAGSISSAEEQFLYACSIFTQLTGLNASSSTYSPVGISSETAVALGNTAETTLNSYQVAERYTTSYELDGAVVYRNLDVSSDQFNDVVRYMYKGSSTHDWTRDALNTIVNSNPLTTAARRKLGTRNGFTFGTRYWHPDDISSQGFKFGLEPNEAAFMYVSGSWNGADAQTVIDLSQANMIPMAFDWIKSFAIPPAVRGTASTVDALDYHSCSELYFNYTERGWKLIPLTIGMGRINEAVPNFVASDDAVHISDPLLYMNANMMLSSALGTDFPFPDEITPADLHRGSYTTEQIRTAAVIGHELIKELAYLSETGGFVPDSNLQISTDDLLGAQVGQQYSFQLSASGGDADYSWEIVSDGGLPQGLTLSSDGLISGTVMDDFETWDAAIKVTDGTGAFRKSGVQLSTGVLLGDVNLDGTVDFLDISPFIALLSNGDYQAEADCDQSGAVGFLDISPFISILSAL